MAGATIADLLAFRNLNQPEGSVYLANALVPKSDRVTTAASTGRRRSEVLQFFLMVFGFAPLVFLGLRDVGGWDGLVARVSDTFTHSWKYLGSAGA